MDLIVAKMLLVLLPNLLKIKNTLFKELTLTLFGAIRKEKDLPHSNFSNPSKSWNLLLIMMAVVL